MPIKKLREHAIKTDQLNSSEYPGLDKSLILNFNTVEYEGKLSVVNFALNAIPINEPDSLVPFLDFFRICLMREDVSK